MSLARFVRYSVAAGVAIAVTVLGAPATQAQPPTPGSAAWTTSDVTSTRVVKAAGSEKEMGTQGACDVDFYGHIGARLCGTDYVWVSFGDGHVREFIIGTDHQVWNIVRYPNGQISGWRSLGGWAQVGVYLWFARAAYDMGIYTIGADGLVWCKHLIGSWSGWYRC